MNRFLSLLFAVCMVGVTLAAPFEDWFEHTLQDGKTVKIWGRGDEYSAVFEDAAGYTILWDADGGVYHYATRDAQSGALIPSSLALGDPIPAGTLEPHLRDTSEAARETTRKRIAADPTRAPREAQWKAIRQASAAREKAIQTDGLQAPPSSPVAGTSVGLTLLVDFPLDDGSGNTLASIAHPSVTAAVLDQLINGEKFTSFSNSCSVRKYYEEVSNGMLSVTNCVIGYVLAPYPRAYYDVSTRSSGASARILIADIFTELTKRSDYTSAILPRLRQLSYVNSDFKALNILFAGPTASVWSHGLWAHAGNLATEQRNLLPVEIDGATRTFNVYQISPITSSPKIFTFTHENGHMVCGFPDLYDYGNDSTGGAGAYCLMGLISGGGGNPVRVCAYLRAAAGWVTPQLIPRTGSGTLTVTAGADDLDCVWKWANPANSKEYFLVENRKQINRDSAILGGGICIWHVDEQGDRDNQSRKYNVTHANYELACEQADGMFAFESAVTTGNDRGDFWFVSNPAQLFQNAFNDSTVPNARWWNGTPSGLSLFNFSEKGSAMTVDYAPGEDLSVSLAEAVDWPQAVFTPSGSGTWIGERFPDIAFYGGDCVRSGPLDHNQTTALSMTLTGPGEFSFYWRVFSEAGGDFFSFSVNGKELFNASGSNDVVWRSTTLQLSEATPSTFVWRYTKNASGSDSMDCVVLDRFVWRDWRALPKPFIENLSAASLQNESITASFDLTDVGQGADWAEVTLEISRHAHFPAIEASASATWTAGEAGNGKRLTATGAFIPEVPYFLRLTARNSLFERTVSEVISTTSIPPVAASLGASSRLFSGDGALPWVSVYGKNHAGEQAWYAQSGAITHSQQSVLETTVEGKGTLTFWWACASEPMYDVLTFALDGVVTHTASGAVLWKKITVPVNTAGSHRFTWCYEKDSSTSRGADCASLAGFQWIPEGMPVFEMAAVSATPVSITVRAEVETLGASAASGVLTLSCESARVEKTCSAAGAHELTLAGLLPDTVYTVTGTLTNNLGVAMVHEHPLVVVTGDAVPIRPDIGAATGGNPLGFSVNTDGSPTFTVAIAEPVVGVYYTPFAAATPGGTYTAGAASTLASGETALILAVPTGNAPRLFVKVVASRTPFAPGDPMP